MNNVSVVESIKKDVEELLRAKQALRHTFSSNNIDDLLKEEKSITDVFGWELDSLSSLANFHVGRIPVHSSRPVSGRLITFAKRLVRKSTFWLYQPIFDQISSFNSSILNVVNKLVISIDSLYSELYNKKLNVLKQVLEEKEKLYKESVSLLKREIEGKNRLIEEKMPLLNMAIDEMEQNLKEKLVSFAIDLAEFKREQVTSSRFAQEMQQKFKEYNQLVEEYRAESVFLRAKLSTFIQQLNLHKQDEEVKQKVNFTSRDLQKTNLDWLYRSFEQHFRGPEELIRKRQRAYLPDIKNAYDSCGGCVLDIGTGRGEMLELLRKIGVAARGVDLNESMVSRCREKGLDVGQADAIDFLTAQADESLAAVTAFQVIEHLVPEQIWQLINISLVKLKPGGLIILETINPDCLVGLKNFYIDLTHEKPIPANTLRFLLEAAGFRNVEAQYSSPLPPEYKLKGEDDNTRKLNEILFGWQDYAVLGWR